MQAQTEIDIIGAMLKSVRETLGAVFTPEAERRIEAQLRNMWGGQDVYVKKKCVDTLARDNDIRKRYNMCNRRELQEEYGLSRGTFYKILRRG